MLQYTSPFARGQTKDDADNLDAGSLCAEKGGLRCFSVSEREPASVRI